MQLRDKLKKNFINYFIKNEGKQFGEIVKRNFTPDILISRSIFITLAVIMDVTSGSGKGILPSLELNIRLFVTLLLVVEILEQLVFAIIKTTLLIRQRRRRRK
jgi:hypothetical protein